MRAHNFLNTLSSRFKPDVEESDLTGSAFKNSFLTLLINLISREEIL